MDYCGYRIVGEIRAPVAAPGGVDALVFTAGIGEHSTGMRARVCAVLGWLEVELDTAANRNAAAPVSSDSRRVTVLCVPTNQELMIARRTRRCRTSRPAPDR